MASGAAPLTSGAGAGSASPSLSSSGLPTPPPPPKILLAKPPAVPRHGRDDDPSSAAAALRSRGAHPPSLNLLSLDSWDFLPDRVLPFLTDNTEFTVIGVIGPPGVGKSTIMNELYGYDASSPGMLLPFVMQSEESKAMARHCTMGLEMRVSSDRFLLIDSQPVFSSSVLVDMMRSDGLSTIPVLSGETLSADLAHELMGIQLGVFLASVCNVLLVVSEGINDYSMWNLILTVDLLKHGLPDPSSLTSGHSMVSNPGEEKENKVDLQTTSEDFLAALVFIHTKLQGQDLFPSTTMRLRSALLQFFKSSSFHVGNHGSESQIASSGSQNRNTEEPDTIGPDLFCIPLKVQEDSEKPQYGSYDAMLGELHDQILSMSGQSFSKNVSERDWLRNSAKIWDMVKKSPVIADYCRILQKSGLFRR